MQEIEAKFKVTDHRIARERLIKMGAKLVWKGREESYFFDTAKRELDKRGEQLRLRSWPGHAVMLTFKKRVDRKEKRYKIRGEYELTLPDIKAARAFIEAMGYKEYFRYYKQREHWKVGEVYVELDRLSGLHFIEVEASRTEIERIAEALGLNWDDAMTKGYVTIVRELTGQQKETRSRRTVSTKKPPEKPSASSK